MANRGGAGPGRAILVVLCVFFLCLQGTQQKSLSVGHFGGLANCSTVACAQQNSVAFLAAGNAAVAGDVVVFDGGRRWWYMPFNPADHGGVVPILENLDSVAISLEGELVLHDNFTAWPTYVHGDKNKTAYYNAIHIRNSTRVTVTGGGTVVGQGETWWRAFFFGKVERQRPTTLYLENAADTTVEHISIFDAPRFNIYADNVDGLEVRYATIWVDVLSQKSIYEELTGIDASYLPPFRDAAHRRAAAAAAPGKTASFPMFPYNTDGVDFHGRNIHLHDLNISNYDDVVAVKASDESYSIQCTENVLVERLTVFVGVGLSIGSIVPAPNKRCVRNVTFRDIALQDPLKVVYVKSGSPGDDSADEAEDLWSGSVTDVLYENITANGSLFPAIYLGPQQQKEPDGGGQGFWEVPTEPRVSFRNIKFKDVVSF